MKGMSRSTHLSVSIVIPAYNEEHYLARCLETILQYKTQDLKEIIVVDNGSTDGTVAVAKRYPLVKVLRFPKPLGLPAARRPGFAVAKGDLIASLDADVLIHEDWFPVLQETFRSHPSLSCLSGPYHYFDFPFFQNIAHRTLNLLLTYPWLRYSRLNGGNFVLRREVLKKVDVFETDVKFWAEDTIIGGKIRSVGTTLYKMHFFVFTSARRWKKTGFWLLGILYFENLLTGFGFFKRRKKASAVR